AAAADLRGDRRPVDQGGSAPLVADRRLSARVVPRTLTAAGTRGRLSERHRARHRRTGAWRPDRAVFQRVRGRAVRGRADGTGAPRAAAFGGFLGRGEGAAAVFGGA